MAYIQAYSLLSDPEYINIVYICLHANYLNKYCLNQIAIRNAGMKQDDIVRVLNVSQSIVSRPLKEHRESGSITKRKRSTLILECKELLLKHYGTSCIIWRPPDTVKGGYWDFERSKIPGRNPGIWC